MSGPATEMFRVAADRLMLPVEHLADLCDYYPADGIIGCPRLRFATLGLEHRLGGSRGLAA